ncbi:MAG TPA: glycosyltransferase N-terminal domain-containing protein [Chitinophagaceae bacterium]|nr:glycosyltransferase N-terminal domain-containing protein [Chitinophagaceae bacterium]
MLVFFYDIFLWLYVAGIRITATWNPKALKWVKGRRDIFDKIGSSVNPNSKIIWVHCSSLGEFEQGRPVMEKLKERFPNFKLLLTFFSPSGYEVKKDYVGADHVFYLPIDSPGNAQRFLSLVNPALVIFVKYDYWYYYLTELKKRNIHCLLVSAVFRKNQSFFKWYGTLQRRMLRCFTEIFVQNEQSKKFLDEIHLKNCVVSGDTRFDRVAEIAEKFEPIPLVENFVRQNKCIVAGSTWKEDEQVLRTAVLHLNDANLKLIIAPHEINASHLEYIKRLFPGAATFSEIASSQPGFIGVAQFSPRKILIIDNIGMLSRLYKYAHIAYVGGGFTRDGVHNVLEGAVYGKPIVFANNYQKYKEAIDLVDCEGAKPFSDAQELIQILYTLINDEEDYRQKCRASKKYVQENVGATGKILDYIEENRLLTS